MANVTTQTIRLDLNSGVGVPIAYVHQNDTARTLVFKMFNNGVSHTMSGSTVKFAYKSPIKDGQYTVITGSSMISGAVSGNTVSVTLPASYTGISGTGMLTMIITPSSGTIRPVNIRLVIEKSADGSDVISGASDFPTTMEETVENYLENSLGGFGVATVAETQNYLGI